MNEFEVKSYKTKINHRKIESFIFKYYFYIVWGFQKIWRNFWGTLLYNLSLSQMFKKLWRKKIQDWKLYYWLMGRSVCLRNIGRKYHRGNKKAKSIKKKSLEYHPLLLYYFYTLLLPVFVRWSIYLLHELKNLYFIPCSFDSPWTKIDYSQRDYLKNVNDAGELRHFPHRIMAKILHRHTVIGFIYTSVR